MKRFKKILGFILCLLMAVHTASAGAFAAETTTQSYLYASKYTAAVNKYTDYKAIKYESLQFAIPGLSNGTTGGVKIAAGFYTDYTPQGITYCNHTQKYYLSAYSESKQNTVLFVLSKSGVYERTLEIASYTGHAGGVACDDNYVYLVSGLSIYYIRLDAITTALQGTGNTVTVTKSRIAVDSALCQMSVGDKSDSSNLFSSCSFCTYFKGLFWFGEFSLNTQNDDYPYRASGESYFFGVDLTNLSAPTLKKVMTVPCQTQGATFFKDSSGNTYLACSMSYGRNNASTMRLYKINQSEWGSDNGVGGGTQTSTGVTRFVHKNNNIKQLSMPNMMEDICTATAGSKVYLLSVYESGAKKYADSASYVMDRVSAIDIGSALGITTDATQAAATHTYQKTGGTAATCTSGGNEKYTCAVCSAQKTQTLAALGHDYSTCAESDATLTADTGGEPTYYYTCSRCGDISDSASFLHTTNTVYGTVDMTKQPKAVTVTLTIDGTVIESRQLAKGGDGRFVFRNVPNGSCSICYSGKALLAREEKNIDFQSGTALRADSALIDSKALCAGDVNADGVIDIADLSAVLKSGVFGANTAILTEDVDESGTVDVGDIAVILLKDNYAKTAS